MNARLLFCGLCLALSLGCGDPAAPAPPGPCDPSLTACTFAHDYGKTALAAGQEIDDECNSWTLDNPTDLWVNAVELSNDGGYHHSNWFFVPDNFFQHKDGKWDCRELHFTELGAALLGGVLFAQSTQATKEVQQFAAGAVVRLPAYARIIGYVHLLNAAGRPVESGLRMALRTIPSDQAKIKLSPLRLTYEDLHLPPKRNAEVSGSCDLSRAFADLQKGPVQMKLHYVLPHYHSLGQSFRVGIAGGPAAGQTLYQVRSEVGEALGKTFDPPVDLAGATGLDFTCGFTNPRDKEVGWGIGDQEMCVMLGFAESKVAFDGTVGKGRPAGERDGTALFEGPCQVDAYNFFP